MLECGTLQYCYTVEPSLKSVCNCDFDVERSSWDDHDIDKHPGVYAAVQDFLQTEEGRQLKVGPVKKRYSRTVADSYLSHGCYYCDAIFGDFHLIEEKLYAFTGVYTIIDNALMPKSNSERCESTAKSPNDRSLNTPKSKMERRYSLTCRFESDVCL